MTHNPQDVPASDAGEAEFLLRRAEEEAILAVRTGESPAADVHFALAIGYSERAISALGDADDEGGPAPQPR
jgi:hypothetical protein